MQSRINLTKKLEIVQKLEEVCYRLTEEPGRCRYRPGYTDEKVAQHLGVGVNNVMGIRRELFGSLRDSRQPRQPDDTLESLQRRLTVVELRLDTVCKELGL